jgi:predicted DNA-binding transcriptional regulator YafY
MRADRLLSIILLLQTRGKMTAGELAGELAVSRRQILRDVEALSFSGIPVYTEGGRGGGIALVEEYRTSLTGLKNVEVQSLMVMNNNHALTDVGLGGAAEQLTLKLLASLPNTQRSTAEHIRQRLLIDPTWWWHDPEVPHFMDDLQKAVYDDCLIEAAYENSTGEVSEKVLAPYSLICKSSLWYLLAERESELRIYRVSRFRSVRVLDRTFPRRPFFDLPAYWQTHTENFDNIQPEYTCTLRIHPDYVAFVSSLMPGRWKIIGESDERGWVTMTLGMDSELFARMLVFGLGGFVEAVDPPELAETVRAQARDLLSAYPNK